MQIKWAALGQTAGVSLAITLAVVVVFALGNLALSRREAAAEAGNANSAKGTAALVAAGVCFAACAGVVLYGISLIAGK
ncbi:MULTISPECIES: hypothetical protein [Kitasatospora]|uniref:Site-specific recombinase n=2 Tax=Kitasatospora TaxID=2063 RepID=A0ABT1IQY9_9ACTN|nr:hypothetical protein [Kitasatospora paracochleata]MCP2307550.1 site-specific recombinase [Kitasatospora paracochleata]